MSLEVHETSIYYKPYLCFNIKLNLFTILPTKNNYAQINPKFFLIHALFSKWNFLLK